MEFDQTMGQGWRALSDAGCHKEAADLIEAYISHNDADQLIMRWHIVQLRAVDGDDERAINAASAVLVEETELKKQGLEGLRWNDYVLATIAFLEKNRESFIYHRNQIEKRKDEHPGNEIHLRYLDILIKNFEQNYEYSLQQF